MKNCTREVSRFFVVCFCLWLSLLAFDARAVFNGDTWDPQGTAGGQPASGSWESSSWSTSTAEAAMSPPVNWVEGGAALFAIGNAGGANTKLTITMDANHTVAGIFNGPLVPASCYLIINGAGTMTMPGTVAQGFDNGGSTLGQTTILVPIAGAAILESEGSGSLFLYGTNTYTGGTLLGGGGGVNFNNNSSFGTGKITWGVAQSVMATPANDGNGNTGATGPIILANAVATISGTQIFAGLAAAPVTFSGPWTLPATGTTTFQNQPAGTTVTINGVISGAAGFTKTGTGKLILGSLNNYTGATVVNNSTLALGATGSINTTPTLTLYPGANGTVFDVSAISSYTLGNSTTLVALGTGTATATEASIKGASGGTVSLGSRPVILSLTPTTFSGDTAHPALYISQGALTLNNNSLTVTNAAATALGIGTYRLIQVGNGSSGVINGAPNATVSIKGTGIATNTTAALVVSNGNLNLVVKPVAVIMNLSFSEIITPGIGPTSVTLTGKVNAGATYPTSGETIGINLNGIITSTTVGDTMGDFSYTFAPSAIPYSSDPYTNTFSYGGDAALGAATSAKLIITPNAYYTNDSLPGFVSGLNLFFTNRAGINMYTWSATNTGLPVSQWNLEGQMQEQPLNDGSGNSRYSINITPALSPIFYVSGPSVNWPYLSPTWVQRIVTDAQTNYTLFNTNVSITTAGVLNLPSPPVILQQPTNLTVLAGKNATFNAIVTGSVPLNYQWYLNTNTPLSNVLTNPLLTLTAVSSNDVGSYSVLISNQYGMATSIVATLSVLPPPQISWLSTPGALQLNAAVVPGEVYWVQSASNLTAPIVWTTAVTGTADSNGMVQFTDSALTNSQLFYRLAFP